MIPTPSLHNTALYFIENIKFRIEYVASKNYPFWRKIFSVSSVSNGVYLLSGKKNVASVKEGTSGRSMVGAEKVWNLAFDDDLIIVAKSENEMKE